MAISDAAYKTQGVRVCNLTGIDHEVGSLNEAALRGFVFEAAHHGGYEDEALWRIVVGQLLVKLSRCALRLAERLCAAIDRVMRRSGPAMPPALTSVLHRRTDADTC